MTRRELDAYGVDDLDVHFYEDEHHEPEERGGHFFTYWLEFVVNGQRQSLNVQHKEEGEQFMDMFSYLVSETLEQ